MKQKRIDGLEVTSIGEKKSCGKAFEIYHDGYFYLVSYLTKVAKFNINNGELVRLWDGYSHTTMRHINEWLQLHCLPTITKKQWMKMEVAR